MAENHEHFMELALEEVAKALKEGNHPYGSVIVRDGAVIARAHSMVGTTSDPTAHAESLAIHNAGIALRQIEFPGCTLYATFEPCPMCCGAIMNARISTLVIGGRPKEQERIARGYSVEGLLELAKWSSRITVVTGVLRERCEAVTEPWRQARRQ